VQIAPDWLALTTESANQHATGSGPHAEVGLSWADLRRFHACLQRSTAVFGSCSLRERLLAAELAAAEAAWTEGGEARSASVAVALTRGPGDRVGVRTSARDVAGRMVARALVDVQA
jgi:hypothetical protein